MSSSSHPPRPRLPGEIGLAADVLQTFGFREWGMLIAIMTASVFAFRWIGQLLGWPVYVRSAASVVSGPHAGAGVAAIALGMLLTVVVATLLLGWLRIEAGLFAAAIGLGGLASKGGTVGALLRATQRPQTYQAFILDTALLLAATGLAWQVMSAFVRRGWAARESDLDLKTTAPRCVLAAVVQAVVMALLLQLLAQNDGMKQVMAAALVAALLGALVAHQLLPLATPVPYWVGPFLVAIGGYLWARAVPGRWMIGVPANPLASVPPLAYASLGTAGAIFGYWTSRKWREVEGEEDEADLILDE